MSILPALALSAALSAAHSPPQTDPTPAFRWDERAAEHLLNRAGFGARRAAVDAAVAAGLDATVARLLDPPTDWEMPAYEPIVEPPQDELKRLSAEERQRVQREVRERDRRQLLEGTAWWLTRMRSDSAPLLEKLTFFWHGFFTTSVEETKRSFLILQQHEFLRDNALGSYADLLRGIARDPAMLVFLDNQVNRKGKPNENLARELMELFSLGVGNFTEQDVKEAARALTGRGADREGRYEFRARQHDDGAKTILGVTGRIDGDQLVEILLKQEACPRHVARRLLAWFEGVEPDPTRLEEYAASLRASGLEIRPFLRKLFTDPRFYRDEIVGARVLGPVEYLVGISRRLDVDTPAGVIGAGAALLGQRVFSPPSVKGWEEGFAWISTSTLMQRGNLAGFLLGVVKLDDVMTTADVEAAMAAETAAPTAGDGMQGAEPMRSDAASSDGAMRGGEAASARVPAPAPKARPSKASGPAMDILRRIDNSGWMPAINLRLRLERAGAQSDAQIVDHMLDDLLAIRAPDDTRVRLREFLATERGQRGIADGRLLAAGGEAERVLRRLAHLILSLPEAQLS